MSDSTTGHAAEGSGGGQEGSKENSSRTPYEAPKLTRLGNARELLAGSSGSIPDTTPPARLTTQSSTP